MENPVATKPDLLEKLDNPSRIKRNKVGAVSRTRGQQEEKANITPEAFEWLLELYKDNKEYARFHEEMREKATYLFLAIDAALFSVIFSLKLAIISLPFALFLMMSSRIGKSITMKHWERVARNTEISHQIRQYLNRQFGTHGESTQTLHLDAEKKHVDRMKGFEKKYKVSVMNVDLEGLWGRIHDLIFYMSIIITFAVLYSFGSCNFLHRYCLSVDSFSLLEIPK